MVKSSGLSPKKLQYNKNLQTFLSLFDQILAVKKKDPNADLPERVRSQSGTSALEKQIDKMVYELYGLTPEEIEIVEGKVN